MLRILILGSLGILCRAQAPLTYTIAGHVVRHLDQRAIKSARVSIAMVEDTARQISVITDENGAFAFQGVPAEKYQLRVTDHGASQFYQQSENYSTAIVTGPKLDTEHILFSLDAPARIAGKVVDEDNDPVPHVSVYLFSQSLQSGKYRIRNRGQAATDTAGAFHFRGLEPGTYYVAVAGQPWYAQNVNAQQGAQVPDSKQMRSDLDVAYPVTYYSGATSPEGATPLKLEEGQRGEVQMTLHAVPGLHITIEDMATEGRQQRGIMVTQSGPGGIAMHLPTMAFGSEIVGIAPGSYTISFLDQSSGSDTRSVTLTGDTTIHLSESVQTSIKGRAILDGGDTTARPIVTLQNDEGEGFFSQTVEADGSFEIPRVAAGHYVLGLANAPDIYVAKADVKGAAYTNGELEVRQGAHVELTITVGHGLAKVDGVVLRDKQPVAGAMVLLIPQDRNHGKTIGRDQSDSDGTFTMAGVTPGRYTLVAIDDGHGLAYADTAVIRPYLQHGQVVDVPVSKSIEVEAQHRLQ